MTRLPRTPTEITGFYGFGQEFQMLEDAIEGAGMAWWILELPSGVIFTSPNKAKMLGRDPRQFVRYTDYTDLIHPDDYEPAMQAMRDHMEGRRKTYETKYRIQCADGSYRTFYDRGKIVARKGAELAIAGLVTDLPNEA